MTSGNLNHIRRRIPSKRTGQLPVKTDLHNHLGLGISKMEKEKFNSIIDLASKTLGRGGIFGISAKNSSDFSCKDFIESPGYDRIRVSGSPGVFYFPKKDLYLILGQEVKTKEGTILVSGVGLNQIVREGASIEDTLKFLENSQGAISTTIVINPYSHNSLGEHLSKNPDFLKRIDAIETYNGSLHGIFKDPNKAARNLYCLGKYAGYNLGEVCFSGGKTKGASKYYTFLEKPELNNFTLTLKESLQNSRREFFGVNDKSFL